MQTKGAARCASARREREGETKRIGWRLQMLPQCAQRYAYDLEVR